MIKTRQYNRENIEICRNCGGTGVSEEQDFVFCPVCEGSGRVKVIRDITVTVKSYQ